MTDNIFGRIDRVLHECDARNLPPLKVPPAKYPRIGTERVISYGPGAEIEPGKASWFERLLAGPFRKRR